VVGRLDIDEIAMRRPLMKGSHLQAHRVVQRQDRADAQVAWWPDGLLKNVDLADDRTVPDHQPGHPRRSFDDLYRVGSRLVCGCQAFDDVRHGQGGPGGEVDVLGRPVDKVMGSECVAACQHESQFGAVLKTDPQETLVELSSRCFGSDTSNASGPDQASLFGSVTAPDDGPASDSKDSGMRSTSR
jgi:hypothetical protein